MKKLTILIIIFACLGVSSLSIEASQPEGNLKLSKDMLNKMNIGDFSYKQSTLLSSNSEVKEKLGVPIRSRNIIIGNKQFLKDTYKINNKQELSFYYYKYKKNLDYNALLVTSINIHYIDSKITKKNFDTSFKLKSINNTKHKNVLYSVYNSRTAIIYSKGKKGYYLKDINYHIADDSYNLTEQ